MQIEHNRNKKKLGGGNQLAIYKRGLGFELGTTKNNPASGQSGTQTSGLPGWESDVTTTWPCCFPSKGTRRVGGGGERRGVKVKGKEGHLQY